MGCKSPEDIGFEAAAKFTAPMAAIGADTATSPCDERLTMFEEFVADEEFRKGRVELAKKVPDAMEKDGFGDGFGRLSDVSEKIFIAFERDCPAQTPKARELAQGLAKELHIESKVPWLTQE